MRLIEPFTQFTTACQGRGLPRLILRQHRVTATLEWSDGSIVDYRLFRLSLDEAALTAALRTLTDDLVEGCELGTLSSRFLMMTAPLSGLWRFVPPDLAREGYDTIRQHYRADRGSGDPGPRCPKSGSGRLTPASRMDRGTNDDDAIWH